MIIGFFGLVDWNVSIMNYFFVQICYWCKNFCRNCYGFGCVVDLFFYDNEFCIVYFVFLIIFFYMILFIVFIF